MTADEPQVLNPFSRAESRTTAEAAEFAGRPVRTIRRWCEQRNIGRRIGGEWAVSIVALDLFLSGEHQALTAYLRGDRQSPEIVEAFERHGVPCRGHRGQRDLPSRRTIATLVAE